MGESNQSNRSIEINWKYPNGYEEGIDQSRLPGVEDGAEDRIAVHHKQETADAGY